MALLFTSAIAYWAAWAAVGLATSSLPRNLSQTVLRAGLALATWLGMESCLRFAWLVCVSPDVPLLGETHHASAWFDWSGPEITFLVGKTIAYFALVCVATLIQSRESGGRPAVPLATRPRVRPALLAAFMIVGAVAVVGFVYTALGEPNGGDDALTIWNLHAKFLYLGGADWERPFLAARTNDVVVAWHLDYPLGLPSLVAGAWAAWGRMEPWLGCAGAGLFAAGALAVTVGGVAVSRGMNQGLLAGVALVGAVGYIQIGARQYADVPLSLYFVAALFCLTLGRQTGPRSWRWLALCGWFVGLAAWTKNEGLLFSLCLGVVAAGSALRERGLRGAASYVGTMLAGAAPALICLAWFQWNLADSNDIVAGQSRGETLARLADPKRYAQIAAAMLGHYFQLGKIVAVAVPLYWIGVGNSAEPAARRARTLLGATLALMVVGYFAVYLVTPRELEWHLSSSLTRLAAQLWPSLVALVFLASRAVDDSESIDSL